MSRKERHWVVSPRPGPHKKFESIPLLIIIRDFLKLADTRRYVERILKTKEVLVDGKPRTDHKFPVGLFDVVEIPKIGKQYRVVPTHSGLNLIEIAKKDASLKLCRINEMTIIKGGKRQINLHDGRNILIKEDETKKVKGNVYKTGDSLLIELPNQKIVDHLKMEKGMLGLIVGGQNMGETATIKEIIIARSREPNKVLCEKGGKKFEAIKDLVFVVGKTESLIKIK